MKEKLLSLLGPAGVVSGAEQLAPYLFEQRGAYIGQAALVARPASVHQVSQIMALCLEHGWPWRVQGGNTGLVGGAAALTPQTLLISCDRLKRIREVRAGNFSLTAEAGCTLEHVQHAATQASLSFPLGLSVGDRARVGGFVSTNAGGENAVRYGVARQLVLGIEAVLPDGTVMQRLAPVHKNTVGPDPMQLFIGGEGHLGFITAATLRLHPICAQQASLWFACDSLKSACRLAFWLRGQADSLVHALEAVPAYGLDLVARHRPTLDAPMAAAPWQLLVQLAAPPAVALAPVVEALRQAPYAQACAASLGEAPWWALRRALPWVQRDEGPSLKHDIALPIDALPAFAHAAARAARPRFGVWALG
jgi:FAD/FMN-containing dehydrogenase